LIIGGIAFATPTEAGPTVPPGTIFPLYTRSETAWLNWSPAITLTNARVKGSAGAASSVLLNDINPPEK
jgi:paraquat-inducible protein B